MRQKGRSCVEVTAPSGRVYWVGPAHASQLGHFPGRNLFGVAVYERRRRWQLHLVYLEPFPGDGDLRARVHELGNEIEEAGWNRPLQTLQRGVIPAWITWWRRRRA